VQLEDMVMGDLKYAILKLLLTPVTLGGMVLAVVLACLIGIALGALAR
jgi:hypothetical protein